MHGPTRVIIILPTFNEEGALPNRLGAIEPAMQQEGFEYQIILVNDASRDSTGRTAREFATRCFSRYFT